MAIAEQLRAARKRAQLTQQALAQRAGVPVETVSRIERGAVRVPIPRTVARLAEALGVPAGWFALPTTPQDEAAAALLLCYLTLEPGDREILLALCRRLAL